MGIESLSYPKMKLLESSKTAFENATPHANTRCGMSRVQYFARFFAHRTNSVFVVVPEAVKFDELLVEFHGLKMATALPACRATCSAMFIAKAVLPMLGLAAMTIISAA
jgi:hypothetical protein